MYSNITGILFKEMFTNLVLQSHVYSQLVCNQNLKASNSKLKEMYEIFYEMKI